MRVYFNTNDVEIKLDEEIIYANNIQMEVKNHFNDHSELSLAYNIPFEEAHKYKDYLEKVKNSISIDLVKNEDEEEIRKLIFKGTIENLEIYMDRGTRRCVIKGVSISKTLDREKRNLAFQSKDITYKDILDEINSRYEEVDIVEEDLSSISVDNILIQYNETDWEFLTRILSKHNKCLLAEKNGVRAHFYSSSKEYTEDMSEVGYSIKRNNENYKEYHLYTNQVYNLGDKITLDMGDSPTELLVVGSRIFLEDHVVEAHYILTMESKFFIEKISNKGISGKAIEGNISEIVEVLDESMADSSVQNSREPKPLNTSIGNLNIQFYENLKLRKDAASFDRKLKEGYYSFPYITPYSAKNSGFYASPEIGDNVVVYFPTEEEKDGIIIGAISSPGSARFNNPNERLFEGNGVSLAISSEGSIALSNNEMNISSQNNVGIKGAGVDVVADSSLGLQGSFVKIKGDSIEEG